MWASPRYLKRIDFLHNSTPAGNLFVGSVLESSCTGVYTLVLRSDPPPAFLAGARSARSLMLLISINANLTLERVMGIEPTLSAWKAEVLPLNYTRNNHWQVVEGEGFEPSKAEPSDLQSDPFGRSGTPPNKPDILADLLYLVNLEIILL